MAVPNPLLILYICSYAWLLVLLFLSNFSVAPATGARSISILGLWWESPTKEEILIKHFTRPFSQFITEMKWIQWLVRLRIWDAHQNVVLNILFIMLLGGTLMAESRSMVLQRFRTIGHEPNHISTRYYTGSVSGKVRYLKKIKSKLAMPWGLCHLVTQIKSTAEKANVVFYWAVTFTENKIWEDGSASIFQHNEWRKLTFFSEGDIHSAYFMFSTFFFLNKQYDIFDDWRFPCHL